MPAGLTADILVVIHFLFIVFAVFGGLLVSKWPRLAFLHIPCAIWAVLIEFGGWTCPLTPLEQQFRAAAGEAGYAGGFIEHTLLPLIYPARMTRDVQLALGGFVLLVNLLIYGGLFIRRSADKTRPK